jgi:hypothetical protein
MTDSVDVFHYVRDQESLTRPELLQLCLDELVAQNFYLASDSQDEIRNAWYRYRKQDALSYESDSTDPINSLAPGISQQIWQEFEQLRQGKQDELIIVAYSLAQSGALKGVEYSVWFYPQEALLRAVMDDIYPDSQPYRHFLNLLELLYNTWHPIYGYQDDGVSPVTTLEEARAGHITWLYDINLWGPDLVDKLGRERVLKTPAWRLTSFDDGGILIVPQLFYADGQKEEYAFTGDKAAAYLGLRSEPPDDERD